MLSSSHKTNERMIFMSKEIRDLLIMAGSFCLVLAFFIFLN